MAVIWQDIIGSDAVERVGYDFEAHELHVVFTGGHQYAYLRVAASEVEQLLAAPSIGTYVNLVIKAKYDYRVVTPRRTLGPHARGHSDRRPDRQRKVGARRKAG